MNAAASERGTLYVVSAASGAGKTSLVNALAASNRDVMLSVSHTTRAQREGEVDGTHYHFVDRPTFARMLDDGAFLESAEVFGNRYGTSESWVRQQLEHGISVVLEIDWQGARQIRQTMPCIGIFVLPPSTEALRARLRARGQDSESVIEQRMRKAIAEMSHYAEFDYLVVNDDFETACADMQSIVRATALHAGQQHIRHAQLISALLNAV